MRVGIGGEELDELSWFDFNNSHVQQARWDGAIRHALGKAVDDCGLARSPWSDEKRRFAAGA